jgi:hypothetical protein
MNNSVLNGLGSAAGYNPPPSASDTSAAVGATPERTKVPNPGNLGKAAQDPNAHGPLAVLKAVATGQLPGVLVPHDAPKIKSTLTPQDITDVGVQMYKPVTKGLAVVLFNPKLVPASTLQVLDKKGKLGSAFPSITTLLGKAKSGASSTDDQTAEPTASPNPPDPANPVGSTPPGNVNSAINDLNLTGSPAPQPPQRVPVLPRPTFSADTQKRVGNVRAKNMNAAGQSVLAGLTQQPL